MYRRTPLRGECRPSLRIRTPPARQVNSPSGQLHVRRSDTARPPVAVRDGSPAEPLLSQPTARSAPRGRGLMLVDSVAASWGCLPSRDGKVVWAALAEGH